MSTALAVNGSVRPSVRVPLEELPTNPYRGIEPFRYEDRHIFFGRQAEIQRLVRSITIYRGFLLYGESGAGKSSLINAGLIPALDEAEFLPCRVRIQPRGGSEFVFERIDIHSSANPPGSSALLFPDWSPEEPRRVTSLDELRKLLSHEGRTRTPVLIFDQFEELVTLVEAVPHGSVEEPRKIQKEICRFLIGLLRDHSIPVKLLFSFREDYFGKLRELLADHPDLTDHFFRLEPLKAHKLNDIILGPFTSERLPPGHFPAKISTQLAERLKEDLVARSVDGRPKLSEVQVACLQLWQASNPEEYFARRGVQGLLEDYLEQALEGISREQRDIAKAILGALVTPSRTRNVISESSLVQNVSRAERVSPEEVRHVLAQLETGTRAIQHEMRHKERYYELVSEFLIDWILYEEAQRVTQRRWRKRFWWAVGVGATVTTLVTAAGFVWSWRLDVEAAAHVAVQSAETGMRAAQNEAREVREQLKIAKEEFHRKTQEYDGEIGKLREQLASTNKELAKAQDDVQETKKRLKATSSDLRIAINQRDDLAVELKATKETLQETQEELSTAKTQLERTQKSLKATSDELKITVKQRDDLSGMLKATQGELSTAKTQLESTQKSLKATSDELKITVKQRDDLSGTLKATQGELSTALREKDAIDSELAQSQQKLQDCTKRLQSCPQ